MNAKEFFKEFENFAPKYTSVYLPITVGFVAFAVICMVGNNYNNHAVKKKYHDASPQREPEIIARSLLLLVVGYIIASGISNSLYAFIDFNQNRKWYTWKNKWFPVMLS
tara:strand:- start:2118 stop:2444 length:327 start_codon:yes stop_codon:yes gene_type:complete